MKGKSDCAENKSVTFNVILFDKNGVAGRIRSLTAEETFHAAERSRGLLRAPEGATEKQVSLIGWKGEVRAISWVLNNQSKIGFKKARRDELEHNLKNYQRCISGRSGGEVCDGS